MARLTTLWVLMFLLGAGCGVSEQQGSQGQSGSAQQGAAGSLAATVKANTFGFDTLQCPQSDAYKAMRGRVSVETSFQVANLVCAEGGAGDSSSPAPLQARVYFMLQSAGGESISLRDDREFECTQHDTGALVRARPTAAIEDSRGVTWERAQIMIPIADVYVEQGDSIDAEFSPRPVAEFSCEYLEGNPAIVESGNEGLWGLQTPYRRGESDVECDVPELKVEGTSLEVIEYTNVSFVAAPGSADIPVTVELTSEDGSTVQYDDVVSVLQPLWPRNSQGTVQSWTVRPRIETLIPWERGRIINDFNAMIVETQQPQCVYRKSLGSSISVE